AASLSSRSMAANAPPSGRDPAAPPDCASPDRAPLAAGHCGNEDDAVWRALDELVEGLGRRALDGDAGFYEVVLHRAVEGLAASGGAVWSMATDGILRVTQSVGTLIDAAPADADGRTRLVASAARTTGAVTSHVAGLAATAVAVRDAADVATDVIEVHREPTGPAGDEAVAGVLEAIADAAATWRRMRAATAATQRGEHAARLLDVASRVAGDPRVEPTAYRIVAEAARLVGADRVALVLATGRHARLVAVSGAAEVARRSATADAFERAAVELVRQGDLEASARDRLIDTTHARQLAAARLVVSPPVSANPQTDDAPQRTVGVLFAERFDAEAPLDESLLVAAGAVCGPALAAAIDASDSVVARGERWARRRFADARFTQRLAAIATGVLVATAALCLVPVEHVVTLRGSIEPVTRREVFAPADGVVVSAPPAHGERVRAGETIVELHSPRLLLDEQRLASELDAARRERDAIAAERLAGDRRDARAADDASLGADGMLAESRVRGLEEQRKLVEAERSALVVVSPIDGIVTTWRPDELLAARPVERGQRLVTVADDRGAWRLELRAEDSRAGLVREAMTRADAPLRVVFELAGEAGVERGGTVERIAMLAEREHQAPPTAPATVRVDVSIDFVDATSVADGDHSLTPGTSVRARVLCGKRSIAYVWFHDLWDALSVGWRL
ncbi:MAG: HlyD family efflux transporter periplasmic adaptor subunit, partial [Lacipirellulaceae bacterium]